MIAKEQLQTLRSELEEMQNPLFLYDNDVDGFCAFLLLRRAMERGKGVAIKTFPDLQAQYLRKVDEFNSDGVVVLDKAEISEEFLEGLAERGVPLIWIDHHKRTDKIVLGESVSYYTSEPTCEPTTYIAQNVFKRKEDEWLAMIGCIGDVYMPEFSKRFTKEYPELFRDGLTAFEALHSTKLGEMVRMINFGLMDTITHVVQLTKYLFHARGPHDLYEENNYTKQFLSRYKELNELYKRHVCNAEEAFEEGTKILLYSYAGDVSMSSEVANRLYYKHPDVLVVVAYKRYDKANISIRGKHALETTRELVRGIEGATGGGHEEATGAMVPIESYETFLERIQNI